MQLRGLDMSPPPSSPRHQQHKHDLGNIGIFICGVCCPLNVLFINQHFNTFLDDWDWRCKSSLKCISLEYDEEDLRNVCVPCSDSELPELVHYVSEASLTSWSWQWRPGGTSSCPPPPRGEWPRSPGESPSEQFLRSWTWSSCWCTSDSGKLWSQVTRCLCWHSATWHPSVTEHIWTKQIRV